MSVAAALTRSPTLDPDEHQEILGLVERIEYLSKELYGQFEPTRDSGVAFTSRLDDWLSSCPGDHVWLDMLRLLSAVYFVGREEFDALMRFAYHRVIVDWLATMPGDFVDFGDWDETIQERLDRCWFCPTTDSMPIATFHHLNRVKGRDLRPDWRSVSELGSSDRIAQYMADNRLRYLVLVEDFVGSGSQVAQALDHAARLAPDVPVLFVPLVIAPKGLAKLEIQVRQLQDEGCDVALRPVVTLGAHSIVTADRVMDEPEVVAASRRAILGSLSVVPNSGLGSDAYGYEETGALVVLGSNTPNNAPPILHEDNDNWKPLFPRSTRRWS